MAEQSYDSETCLCELYWAASLISNQVKIRVQPGVVCLRKRPLTLKSQPHNRTRKDISLFWFLAPSMCDSLEENLPLVCVCVCVLYCQNFPGAERIFVSLSSKQSCQSLWNTKLLIGLALCFLPASETVISRPVLASQEQTRVPPAKLASLYSTDTHTHTHLLFWLWWNLEW